MGNADRPKKESPTGGHQSSSKKDKTRDHNTMIRTEKSRKLSDILPAIPSCVPGLKKESANSLCGPCPKCKEGEDRFYYKKDTRRFACRHCHPEQGDIIEFHRWLKGCDFNELYAMYFPDETSERHAAGIGYLVNERKIPRAIVHQAIKSGQIWQQTYDSGPAVACRYTDLEGNNHDKRTIQYLPVDGSDKKFKRGSKASEDFFIIGPNGNRLDPEKPVFVVESVVNALSVACVMPDHNCIALGGAGITKKVKGLKDKGCQQVIAFFDNDNPGRKAAIAVSRIIPETKVVQWPAEYPKGYDVNDLLKAGKTEVIRQLIDAAAPIPKDDIPPEDPKEEKKPKESMTDQMVNLIPAKRLFCDLMGDAYVSIESNGHIETLPLKSRVFREYLSDLAQNRFGRTPTSQALQDTINNLCGKSRAGGTVLPVFVRIGELGGKIYLDLGDPHWKAVEVDAEGWRIISDVPVRFRRPPGLMEISKPESGGSVDLLLDVINVKTGWSFRRLVGYLLAALWPRGPYPILEIQGEQGSAKSSTARFCRQLIDPNIADLRSIPRCEQDLVLAARNGLVIAIDNISNVKDWLSDALCRIATGAGFSTRALYSDLDEILVRYEKPVLLTGIGGFSNRADLKDRIIAVELSAIPPSQRRTESELRREFEAIRGKVLGALLTALSSGIRYQNDIHLTERPRMADAAERWCACERGGSLPWAEGGILEAFLESRNSMIQDYITGDPVANGISQLISDGGDWSGTAGDLIEALESRGLKSGKFWPETPRAMSGHIRRAASFLRESGIEIDFKRVGQERSRKFFITRIESSCKSPAISSISPSVDGFERNNDDLMGDRKESLSHSLPSVEGALPSAGPPPSPGEQNKKNGSYRPRQAADNGIPSMMESKQNQDDKNFTDGMADMDGKKPSLSFDESENDTEIF